ncbi:bidirectional sugar transporter SWEET4-like [Tasmannia lanceolata]|uniref:bidirectional sugar transporter SWEET4-like n=1 Tax=Tasmannia lanceolata TaxID=3420 RepID=UPI0040644CFC
MFSAEIARAVVGILGNILSLGLLLSPVPMLFEIWKRGSIEKFTADPYLASLLNCMLWVLYALPVVHPHSILVLTINVLGCLIELSYVLLFLFYSTGKKRVKLFWMLIAEISFVGVVTIFIFLLAHTHTRRSLVGTLCIFFCTLMYALPLSVMKTVIQTRSVEYMPFLLSLATFVARLPGFAMRSSPLTSTLQQRQMEVMKDKEAALAEVVVTGDPKKNCIAPDSTRVFGDPPE